MGTDMKANSPRQEQASTALLPRQKSPPIKSVMNEEPVPLVRLANGNYQ